MTKKGYVTKGVSKANVNFVTENIGKFPGYVCTSDIAALLTYNKIKGDKPIELEFVRAFMNKLGVKQHTIKDSSGRLLVEQEVFVENWNKFCKAYPDANHAIIRKGQLEKTLQRLHRYYNGLKEDKDE